MIFKYHAKFNKRVEKFQFWTHENHAVELTSNEMIESIVNYIHQNPVRLVMLNLSMSIFTQVQKILLGNWLYWKLMSFSGKYKYSVVANYAERGEPLDNDGEYPDYVFDDKYNLMSLADFSKFIKREKHLPHIPTAIDFKKENKGLAVSDMLLKLLRTQEEQALYIVQLHEQNELLKKQIELLQKK
jgi:hypothetical protein